MACLDWCVCVHCVAYCCLPNTVQAIVQLHSRWWATFIAWNLKSLRRWAFTHASQHYTPVDQSWLTLLLQMGACFTLIFEGCPLKVNATATWMNPVTRGGLLLVLSLPPLQPYWFFCLFGFSSNDHFRHQWRHLLSQLARTRWCYPRACKFIDLASSPKTRLTGLLTS